MLRTPLFEGNLEARRRRALAAIFGDIGTEMVDRVVAEAVRASTFFGLTGDTAERYGRSIRATLVPALEAVTENDPAARDRKVNALTASVRAVSDEYHVPRIIERGLVSIAFGIAGSLIRKRASGSGFTEEELDREFLAFRGEFERSLYRD